jgi:carbon-monoxide dehydrogenase medium subunit
MIPFDLAEPKTLAEAVKLLDPDDPTVRPSGGCTALMLMMKAGVFHPTKIVSLRKVEPKYSSIAVEGNGLRIGALTTLGALERSDEVKKHLPLVSRTLLTLANIRVRNVATVGGALAHGDPHMDLPPVLMSLGAVVTITGPKGDRTASLEEMLTGYYETSLEKDELITSVHVPSQGGSRGAYMKVTTGSADDWPAVGIAAVLDAEGDAVKSASIVVSAATTKATRIAGAEALLNGKTIDDKILGDAAEATLEECEILSDVRGSVSYKRELVRVYLKRAVRSALDGKMGAH